MKWPASWLSIVLVANLRVADGKGWVKITELVRKYRGSTTEPSIHKVLGRLWGRKWIERTPVTSETGNLGYAVRLTKAGRDGTREFFEHMKTL